MNKLFFPFAAIVFGMSIAIGAQPVNTPKQPAPPTAAKPATAAPTKTITLTKPESDELALSQANITIVQQQYQLLKDQLEKLSAVQKEKEKDFADAVIEQNKIKAKLSATYKYPDAQETQYSQDQKTKLFTVTYSDKPAETPKEEKK